MGLGGESMLSAPPQRDNRDESSTKDSNRNTELETKHRNAEQPSFEKVDGKYHVFIVKDDVVECATTMATPSLAAASQLSAISGGDDDVDDRTPSGLLGSTRLSSRARELSNRGSDFVVRSWRDRPRDPTAILAILRRNLITFLLVLVAGVATWELSVPGLRNFVNLSAIFPIYLPHAVALALASVWTLSIAPGNVAGLYLVRMYMAWRGSGFTSLNTTVMFVVAVLATIQSHVGAYHLRKRLCNNNRKRIPTIDSVADAVWFLLIVTVTSLIFCTIIAICIATTPLVNWSGFWRFWGTWWLGVLTAMVTVTPLITHLWAWECQPSLMRPGKVLECMVTTLVVVGILTIIFFFNFRSFNPLPYLCFPLITFTAFRFNRVGWALTVSAIAFSCAMGTLRRRGAMYAMTGRPPVGAAALVLQIELFSIVMGVVSITLAAAVREKKKLTRTLHHMNVELEIKVDRRTLELRKINEELQISQKKAEMASHAKSDFLANMSHEIRTPIHGILGLTALLLESELSVDQKESLVSVKECADLLLHIINSVLDLAKIEAGRLEVESVPFNIRKMVSSTFRMLQARAQERNLKLFCEVDRGVPHSLIGDVGKLQQCLLNLVGNALKFTHAGSVSVHVKVASDDLKASMGKAAGHTANDAHGDSSRVDIVDKISVVDPHAPESLLIHFEVRDTGIGINREKLNDMFKPFTQADASTSRLYGGTGLGLCIVHRFVELLGGTIWVESEVEKGSTFHFCLPLFLNTPPKEVGSAEASPRVRSPGNVNDNNNKSWSLMGGLVFKHCSTGAESGPHSRASKNGSRVLSANDLEAMWEAGGAAGSTKISIEDPSVFRETVSKRREALYNSGLASLLGLTQPDGFGRARRASASDYEAYKDAESVITNNPDYEHTRARISQVHGTSNRDGDRGASNEVTTSGVSPPPYENPPAGERLVNPDSSSTQLELVPLQSMTLPSLRIARPPTTESCADAVAVARGSGMAPQDPGIPTPPSDLSRGSSTELEKMLVQKLELNILLAEDNVINQKVASRQLAKHGHTVAVVGDGQQALDALCAQHDKFDLVLMDVQMPIMDGLRATEQIRKAEMENGWSRVPILGLTAHAIHGYQDTCLIHGMDGYLGKPFDIQQLLRTIGHILPPDKLRIPGG